MDSESEEPEASALLLTQRTALVPAAAAQPRAAVPTPPPAAAPSTPVPAAVRLAAPAAAAAVPRGRQTQPATSALRPGPRPAAVVPAAGAGAGTAATPAAGTAGTGRSGGGKRSTKQARPVVKALCESGALRPGESRLQLVLDGREHSCLVLQGGHLLGDSGKVHPQLSGWANPLLNALTTHVLHEHSRLWLLALSLWALTPFLVGRALHVLLPSSSCAPCAGSARDVAYTAVSVRAVDDAEDASPAHRRRED